MRRVELTPEELSALQAEMSDPRNVDRLQVRCSTPAKNTPRDVVEEPLRPEERPGGGKGMHLLRKENGDLVLQVRHGRCCVWGGDENDILLGNVEEGR